MFLPTEGLYSMAVANDQSLIEDAADQDIILASPTTVMGLLRIAMYGWQQQAMAEEARTISAMACELYKRISTFGEHMQKLGRNLSTALNAYNSAVGSLENSVLPGARRFKEMHLQTGGKEIPQLQPLEEGVRNIAAGELLDSRTDEDSEAEESGKKADT
jgi:DNA recombination protein RmuC